MSGPHIHDSYPDEMGCVKVDWDPIYEHDRGGQFLGIPSRTSLPALSMILSMMDMRGTLQ